MLLLLRIDRKKALRGEEHFPSPSSPVEDIESKSEVSDTLDQVAVLEREVQAKNALR